MMRSRECVVMFCGPNYGKLDWSRIRAAILMAKMRRCSIIICGDANGNRDVKTYARIARRSRIPYVVCPNGRHTRGDAMHAAAVLAGACSHVERVLVVTHWYHLPRAFIALRQEIARPVSLIPVPVLRSFRDGLRRLPGEILGVCDYLLGNPQRTRGPVRGKPDFAGE